MELQPLTGEPGLRAPLLVLATAALVGVGATPALVWLLGGSPLLGLVLALAAGGAAAGLVAWRLAGSLAGAESVGRALAAVARGQSPALLLPRDVAPDASVEGFNQLCAAYAEAQEQTRRMAERLHALPASLSQAFDDLARGGEEQEAAVEESASLLSHIDASIRRINGEVENLAGAAEAVSSAVLEMGSSIDEVARSTGALSESVDASTASVHEMSASIRQVAESGESVQSMAEESAAAMAEMDQAIQEVRDHAQGAAALTQQVAAEGEAGSREVRATIEGIHEIRTLTGDAKHVLERLAQRIAEIGEIVDVISGINEETNLLSLNAAIIAAQAGEQGKAFAVVANHVKTLAQRTASSTKEIAALIHAVQQESGNALQAMQAGTRAVEEGVARSQRAGEALGLIRGSAQEASVRVAEIARATGEQARNSRHVAEAAQTTSAMVQQISSAVSQQSRASESLLQNAEQALDTCRRVHRSTEEQIDSSRFITTSVTSIRDRIHSIRENTRAHETASHAMAAAVERILGVARKALERIPHVQSVLQQVQREAEPGGAERDARG
ncbi:MAG TPA: methyl-accepting chemotaxis protein [Myxococcota bacterium]|nr:methyl-accepting chemotaxis protein [Myxococcota bacterium]